MIGKLDDTQIDELLRAERIGRLGCHADGRTYVVPISYVYDGQYLYGHAVEGQKIQMMRAQPEVCLQVDRVKNLAHWRSVIVWGTFEELHGEEALNVARLLVKRLLPLFRKAAHQLQQKSAEQEAEVAEQAARHGVIYRIRITEKTGRYEEAA